MKQTPRGAESETKQIYSFLFQSTVCFSRNTLSLCPFLIVISVVRQAETTMSTLNQQYDEQVRPLIDLIDSLRSLGVEKDLALPAIAVIGDQSSGKSSVLEALSGVALPRGSGIVTRCPLELKMMKKKEGEAWYGKISYRDFEEKIKEPALVEKMIREAQLKLVGNEVGISSELISLEIASPDVPDLTLIDLPGIARVAVDGQSADIGDKIKTMIQTVISKQETINLVVVPCNVDIATTEALNMAKLVDPDGERTLGVLTKPDLVDKGTEENVVKIVHNEVIPLKKGYMVVKCRGQKEITEKVSLSEALKNEEAFFKEHTHFQTLFDEGQATVPKLAEKLTLELVHHIQKSLPRLDEQTQKKLEQTRANLNKLRTGPPSDATKRQKFLSDLVSAFTQDAIRLTTGEELKCGYNSSIFFTLRNEFEAWEKIIKDSGSSFKEHILREESQFERMYRGRELPLFVSYSTFESIIQKQIKQLEEPAIQKLKEVSEVVRKELFELAQNSFVGFPNLINTAKMNIETIRNEREEEAKYILGMQFKMEMVVYTQDSKYITEIQNEIAKKGQLYFGGMTSKEMMRHFEVYFNIAGQRLADQIPLLIRYQMLQEFASELQSKMLDTFTDKERKEYLLQEDGGTKNKREDLKMRLERLTRAHILLSDFQNFQPDS
ncbi:interferon-induced GTP-binding protein Mx isoform X1 [Oreochromis niloticus]|uniref:interferon-induced GTP-binding protein Mx isoform X1 n=1 Tax=Oreochromis niloticus TaxID=8128 RepID=UPI000904F596|nr:interferon-induced GTP-binding protein Mx isoform X1 [Oreochromis niloticus]